MLFIEAMERVKAAGQPLNKDVLIAYLDNALNYISEAIPRENEDGDFNGSCYGYK
jgi:hypothetical protein